MKAVGAVRAVWRVTEFWSSPKRKRAVSCCLASCWTSPKGPVSCWSSPKGPVASVHLQGIGVIVRVEVVGLSARPDFSTWSG